MQFAGFGVRGPMLAMAVGLPVLGLILSGCEPPETVETPVTAPKATVTAAPSAAPIPVVAAPPAPVEAAPVPAPMNPATPAPPPGPSPETVAAEKLLAEVAAALEKDNLDLATEGLEKAETLGAKVDSKVQEQIEAQRQAVDQKLTAMQTQRRAKQISEARDLLAAGKLEEATLAIDDILKTFPSDEDRRVVDGFRKQIEDRRRRTREMGIALKLLSSEMPTDVRGARSKLVADPDVALPLLAGVIQGKDIRAATNALEMLRSFSDPPRTIPLLVATLNRGESAALWPVAIRELQKISVPGAGPALLETYAKTTDPAQRSAALSALAGIVDPPRQTLVTLLPALFTESSELATALTAAQHAAVVHSQVDLQSLRGFDDLTAEQSQRLTQLPERLTLLSASADPAVAQSAQSFGMLTRCVMPKPLADVKLLRSSAEIAESPGSALLDGVWNSIDIKTMWRYPGDKPATLVLDLGSERSVAAIRFWNLNEPGTKQHGWKDVEVYVSNTPAALTPVAKGIVVQAPGAADTHDYSSTITVPCVRGRYIRLECRSAWQPAGTSGLSEIQILGF